MRIKHFIVQLVVINILFGLTCSKDPERLDNAELLVLEGATLIDGSGSPPRENIVIMVQGDRITKVAQAGFESYPDDATIMDLRGRFVLPGFIDVHVHLAPDFEVRRQTMKTFLAFGITTIRNAGAVPEAGIELKKKVASGDLVGPRMFTAGKFIAGRGFRSQVNEVVETEAEIRNEVRRQAGFGVDFIKLQRQLSPNLVRAAIAEAHSHGIKVIGHLGKTRWTEAARAGIDALCHSNWDGPLKDLIPQSQRDELFDPRHKDSPEKIRRWRDVVKLNGPEMDDLVSALLHNGVEVNPTLVSTQAVWWGDDLDVLKQLEPGYAPEATLTDWWWRENWHERHPYSKNLSHESLAELKATFPIILEIVRILHQRGVLITAGTDVGNPWMTPGVSFHRELELLAKAGIPPLEVVSIATRNGAEALGILAEIGTVEEGKIADLVILTANPLDNIRHTREIEFVIKSGRRFAPKSLIGQSVSHKQTEEDLSVFPVQDKHD